MLVLFINAFYHVGYGIGAPVLAAPVAAYSAGPIGYGNEAYGAPLAYAGHGAVYGAPSAYSVGIQHASIAAPVAYGKVGYAGALGGYGGHY